MITRVLSSLILVWASVAGLGQSLPYTVFKDLEDSAKELRQIEGVTAELQLEHRDPKDTRRFQLALEVEKARKPIKVNKDGTFRLPEVPMDKQAQAQVTHSLEKGALKLSFAFSIRSVLPKPANSDTNSLFELGSVMSNQFDKMEPAIVKVGNSIPYFKNLQIALVGVSLPREKPCSGMAILKNGERTVASIDLSQTGKVFWMFSDYDPRTHRVIFEMKNGDAEPRLYMEVKYGNEAVGSKNAIPLRKPK